jgi:hypothetical protein
MPGSIDSNKITLPIIKQLYFFTFVKLLYRIYMSKEFNFVRDWINAVTIGHCLVMVNRILKTKLHFNHAKRIIVAHNKDHHILIDKIC